MTRARHLVYALIDPRSLLVRYIGKSSSGLARVKAHRNPSGRAQKTYSAAWVKSLQALGLDYQYTILEVCSDAEVTGAAEQWWIAYGRLSDWPLTNLTDGGEGCPGYKKSAETRAKIGNANRGRTRSLETRARMSAAARARSPETLAKIGAASKERWPRIRERVLAARPLVVSEETGRKISNALTGRTRGPYKKHNK